MDKPLPDNPNPANQPESLTQSQRLRLTELTKSLAQVTMPKITLLSRLTDRIKNL
jgi:hypothetical protein